MEVPMKTEMKSFKPVLFIKTDEDIADYLNGAYLE